jgi:5'-nucleotidase
MEIRSRLAAAGAAALLATALTASAGAAAGPKDKPTTPPAHAGTQGPPPHAAAAPVEVQMLSFNDYHGHLEAQSGQSVSNDPARTLVGGAEYLSTKLTELRAEAPGGRSLTVAAGDLIGGSPFLSGIFHDEPSVESLNLMGLDVSSVGNHEFDEGTEELLRMQHGGCHPEDGCYFPEAPYAGADFQWLAANVVKKDDGETLLPGTSVKTITATIAGPGKRVRTQDFRIGFIGMTLEATPTLVSPSGIATVDFLDEVETANREAAKLTEMGVNAIVVLLHEGGFQAGTFNECKGISGPIASMATEFSPEIDQIVTGHTHQAYVCSIPDPDGQPRLVTSAAQYGHAVTEATLVLNGRTGEVDRAATTATNHLVTRDAKDPEMTALLDKWRPLAAEIGGQIVGSVAQDILGDASGNRGIETPMANTVADAFLAATAAAPHNAQIAFQNVGGTRASLRFNEISAGEQPGEVTYAEAYAVTPFGNVVLSMDMTGAQIKQVLEEQYQPVPARGSRPMLALGVSDGFTYTWDDTQPQGSRVVPGSMQLNGQPIDLGATYRVATVNFLADGGDLFTTFTQGTNRIGAGEDVAAFVAYLGANPGLMPPPDRIAGL